MKQPITQLIKKTRKNNRSIALIGFMGTGKTTLASLLAKKLDFQLIDTDAMIEKNQGRKISEIFEKDGEKTFRELETEVLQTVLLKDKQVIATGGGIILKENNRQLLKTHSYLVCLTASPEIIYKRIKAENSRPLLMTADPKGQIEKLLAARKEYYQIAHLTIDTSQLDPETICEKIIMTYHKSFEKIK